MPAVLKFRMTDEMLRKKIAEISSNSARVVVTDHAKKRMKQRKILMTQVLEVLTKGAIKEPAHQDVKGNWRCTLERRVSGDLVRVPAAIESLESGDVVVVITAMN